MIQITINHVKSIYRDLALKHPEQIRACHLIEGARRRLAKEGVAALQGIRFDPLVAKAE